MARWLKITLWVVLGVAVVAVALVGFLFLPIGDPNLSSQPNPAPSYDAALQRIAAKQAAETVGPPLQPITHSVALLHGSRVETAVVIFHGYTHSPYQWRVVSKAFYDGGYNVWAPLAPYHGEADRMTGDLSKLTPELLRQYADEGVDVGTGLGRHVEVVGLSTGGDVAVWAAAERPDVTKTIAIAPAMDPRGVPAWVLMPVARWYRYMPDNFNWWQPSQKAAMPGPAYPRFSFRGMFAFVQLTQWALHRADAGGYPVTGALEMVANPADRSVDTTFNVDSARRLAPPGELEVFEIPASAGFGHDLIEPDGENKKIISQVYPVVARALGVPLPDPRVLGSATTSATPSPATRP